MTGDARELRIELPAGGSVSALLREPTSPRAGFAFAHGAGAGMRHAFMQALAEALAHRGIATLRYQFPNMEQGSKRVDRPPVAQEAVRAAVARAAAAWPGLPLFAGGKSFGARMTSQAQAAQPLGAVRGLVFVGFPLHPANQPATQRAGHLAQVEVPMLFLQGTRDALADNALVRQVTGGLGDRATLVAVEGADHAFHVLVRSGRTDAEVIGQLADATRDWIDGVLA